MQRLDENGYEILDPTPHSVTIGFEHCDDDDFMNRIKSELRAEFLAHHAPDGVPDDADDFDVQDAFEMEPVSPYEERMMSLPSPSIPKQKAEPQKPETVSGDSADHSTHT